MSACSPSHRVPSSTTLSPRPAPRRVPSHPARLLTLPARVQFAHLERPFGFERALELCFPGRRRGARHGPSRPAQPPVARRAQRAPGARQHCGFCMTPLAHCESVAPGGQLADTSIKINIDNPASEPRVPCTGTSIDRDSSLLRIFRICALGGADKKVQSQSASAVETHTHRVTHTHSPDRQRRFLGESTLNAYLEHRGRDQWRGPVRLPT